MQATLPLRERVLRILNLIRPAVQSDGGDVELIDISDEGVVRIRLHGSCVGCPSSSVTLKLGIERNLKEHIPEITSVEAIED
ncbi:MAG TPA: NifU family protein [Phycisphaerales bacterium]|nr:NifU family protein [Phycisphaerales bacterium]